MKKTKLLTSIAALALVLSLGACTEPEEGGTTEESSETTQTTESSTDTETTTSENTSEDGTTSESTSEDGTTSESTSEDNTSENSSSGDTSSDDNNPEPDPEPDPEPEEPDCDHVLSDTYTISGDDDRYHIQVCSLCGYELKNPHQVDANGDCEFCDANGLNTEGLTYASNDDGTYYVSGYEMTLTARDVYIPSTHDGAAVTGVGKPGASKNADAAFSYNSSYPNHLQFVSLPTSINVINPYAFRQAYSIQHINIPDGVTSIGDYAFGSCYSLQEITIPDGVTYIGQNAFLYCAALKEVTIPASVTTIGKDAFKNCYGNLTNVYFKEDESLTYEEDCTIGDEAFLNCYALKSINIPDRFTVIGQKAFNNCESLSEIKLPATITQIAANTFDSCYSLNSLVIPKGVTSIGGSVFDNCYSLNQLYLPSSLTSVDSSSFDRCYSFTDVYFGGGESAKDSIGTLPTLLEAATWHYEATSNDLLENDSFIDINEEDNTSCDHVFGNASVWSEDERYHEKVCTLCGYSYKEVHEADGNGNCTACNATGLNIEGLTYTLSDDYSAYYVTGYDMTLEARDLYIPTTHDGKPVTGVGKSGASTSSSSVFSGSTTKGNHLQFVSIPSSVTIIWGYAFYNCYSLKTINIPDSLYQLNEAAFAYCYSLQSVEITNNCHVRTLGDDLFQHCACLKSFDIPCNVISLGARAFVNCWTLESVNFLEGEPEDPAGDKEDSGIGETCFNDDYLLKAIDIPDRFTSLGASSFYECYALESVSLSENITALPNNTFRSCYSLISFVIPDSITSLGQYAFGACYCLTTIVMPTSVKTVDKYGFYNCYSLTDVYYLGTESTKNSTITIESSNNTLIINSTWHYQDENGNWID